MKKHRTLSVILVLSVCLLLVGCLEWFMAENYETYDIKIENGDSWDKPIFKLKQISGGIGGLSSFNVYNIKTPYSAKSENELMWGGENPRIGLVDEAITYGDNTKLGLDIPMKPLMLDEIYLVRTNCSSDVYFMIKQEKGKYKVIQGATPLNMWER